VGLHRSGSTRDTALAYGFVAGQFALLAVLIVWEPAPGWVLPGWLDRAAAIAGLAGAVWLVLGLLNLGRSATALPLPVVHGELRTGGLYRLSRHPIYTGLLAIAWSAGVRAASPWSLGVAAALTALLSAKARFEERELRRAYPGYAAYAARTARFLPVGSLGRRSRVDAGNDGIDGT
jgi:protein-S-isoprenylcysteine O-methyltransferase Ste14